MKLRILSTARLSFPLASALAALLAVPSATAAVLTWNNGAATENWNTADLNWSGASPWSNATPDDAVFGAVGAGTVTLTEAITAGSVAINTAGYTITGSTITLNSGVTALTSNAASTVNSNVTLATAAGTITSSAGILTLGGTLDAGSLALTFDGAGSTTVSNAIANGDSLTKNGTGTLTLSGANSYPGVTNVNVGSLSVTNDTALGTTAGKTVVSSTLAGNVTLSLSSAILDLNIAEDIDFLGNALGSSAILINNSAFNHTLSGAIGVSAVSDFGFPQWESLGTGSISITGDITGDLEGSAILIRGTSIGDNKITGSILTTNGGITKTDGGTWTIGGGVGKTYTANALGVANGTLKMGALNYVTAAPVVTLGNSTGGSTGILDLNGFSQTVGGIIYNGAGVATLTRTITSSAGPAVLTVNNATDFTATGSGANSVVLKGNLGLTKQGAGTLSLGGTNTYIGATTVEAGGGTLQLGNGTAGGSLSTSSAISIGASGIFAVNQTDTVIQGTDFSSAVISGDGGFRQAGTGTTVLNLANTYTGGTTVTGGRLIATSGSALGSGSLTVDADKTFSYRPNAAGPLTIGGTLNLGNGTTTNIGTVVGGAVNQSRIDVTGAATLLGTGVVDVNFISGVAPTPGTNQLITAASGLDGGTYTLGTVFNNSDYTVTNFQRTGIAISVDVATATALSGNVFWKGGLAGNTGVWAASTGLSGGASNWQVTNGVDQPLVPGAAADLVFSAANSPGTMAGMTLGADMTLQSLTINNTATAFGLGADGYTLTLTPATPAGGLTLNTGVLASTIGANVALGADQTWTNNSTNTLTVSGVVSGGFSLTKAGIGPISLTGANTYTGTTVINGGTLTVTGSLNGTTGTALTFGGSGTLNVAEPANSAQGMGALTLGAGDGAVTSTAAGATSIATLTFGSLSTRSAGATANLTLAANTSSIGATPNKIVFTDTTNVPLAGGSNDPGIFFGGANYARYDAAGFVRAVAYDNTEAPAALTGPGVTTLGATTAATDVRFTGSARATTTSGAISAANTNTLAVTNGTLFTVGQILTGTNIAANTYITAITGNTLTLTNANVANSIGTAVAAGATLTPYNSVTAQTTASVNTLNLSGTGASLTLGSGETLSINGILRSGAATSGVISGGTGIQTVSGGGELVIRTNLAADLLTLATPILDNGVSSLTKSGAGTLLLSGANTYAGETFLNGGTLRITNANSLGANTDVNVTGSSRISASGGITYANAITVNSGRTLDLLNPATGSASTAEFTGVLSGTGNLFLPNSGGNGIEGILSFTNAASFTGNVVLSVSGAGNEHFKFASIGDGGNFTFAKNGNRQLITYTGAAPITFDTRQIVVATTMFNGGATDRQGMDGNGSNGVSIFANDATDIGSTVTFNTDMVVNNIASTYGVLYFGGTNAGDNTFAGDISDTSGASKLCIGKFGAGKWILSGSNTYEGNTLISNGTLSVNTIANAATPQPLGIGPAIQLGVGNSGNTGTLSYTGGIASTDKQVVIGSPANTVNQAAVGSFLNNGSGPLTFTNPTFNPTSTSYIQPGTSTSLPGFVTATRTLTLGGTYADGTNEIQGVIQNNSSVSGTGAGIVGLTVSASNWKLSGANTYTGLTTVNGGTLQLGNAGALGFGGLQRNVATSGTTVSGGGSLDLNGTTAISEPITLNTSSSTALVNSNTSAAASIGSGIAGITLGTAGSGYSAPPTITINGTGTGATAVASLGLTAATFGTATLTGTRTGAVGAVITGGGGTGATATVTTAGLLTITHPGTGYTSGPTITVTVTGGTITYTPNANSFIVTAVQMTNAGSGYTGTPTYTFDSGSATAGVVSRSSVILSANSSIGGAGDMTIDAVVSQSGGAPGLTKVGAGTLTLTAANTYTGNTNVSEGALILADNAQLSFVLGASGINNSITGAGTVTLEGDFNINTTAADGLSSGSWTLENVDTLAGAYGSSFTVTGFSDIGGDKWEKTLLSGKIYTFDETTGTLTLVTPDPFPAWAASKGLTGAPGFENGKGDDPDGDGFTNLDEFAFDGNPLSGANDGKIVGKIATVGPDQVMTLTLPVRNGATFANDGGDQLSALTDGIYYRVEGSLDLSVFANTVTEVTPAITAGLPSLSTGWTYRTFRAPGTVPTVSMTFLRVNASETP